MQRLTAYKYRIYPTLHQRILLDKHFSASIWVYNWALQRKIESYQQAGHSLSRYDLQKELTLLKKKEQTSWLKIPNAQSLQVVLLNLDVAYTKFFREKRGFPKFKNYHSKHSIQFPQHSLVSFQQSKLYVTKFQEGIKCIFHRKFNGEIRNVTITQVPSGKYFASILVKEDVIKSEQKEVAYDTALGIDMGIKDYIVTSNGEKYENPKYLESAQLKLTREQKRLSKMTKGGQNWRKQKIKVARLHEKIKNQRQDYLHKISRELVDSNSDTFCLEKLQVQGMMKNKHLSKAIQDCSWSTFTNYLFYKSELVGKNILEIGTFEPSSKMCNKCGYINKDLTLANREWTCKQCGEKHNRDINAAKNIKDFAFDKQNRVGHTRIEACRD